MSTQLYLTETQARACPLARSQIRLGEIVDAYGGLDTAGSTRAPGIDEAVLAPAPIWCELPRRGDERAVDVWGYARCSLAVFGRQVSATSVALGVESRESQGRWPSLDEALACTGTTWTSKLLHSPAGVADRFLLHAQPDADLQPRGLNLRLLTTIRSREELQALESAIEHVDGSRRPNSLPHTPSAWGRALFVNDRGQIPSEINPATLEEISLEIGGRSVPMCAQVTLRRLLGARAEYLVIAVCAMEPLGDEEASEVDALMRRSLEHALAHDWLAARAEQLNDRHAACVAELFDEDTSAVRMERLRRQLGLLHIAFVNELELTWGYEADRPHGADTLYALIDHATQLRQRWSRELTRFERLASASASASALAPIHAPPTITQPDAVPGLKEEHNPLKQVKLWRNYRAHVRRRGEIGQPWALRRRGSRHQQNVPQGARLIELHPFSNRYALFEELNASIALTSFMTAASAVFLGVILQKGRYSPLPMDVLFLFIATFGFLFATLIYANASGMLARHGTFGFEAPVEIANRVSEYLGVFPLLVAIPVSVSRFVRTGPIPWAVALLALLAMIAYHYVHGASLLERDVSDERIGSDWQRKVVFVPILALLMAATFLGELLGIGSLEVIGGVGFSLASLVVLLLSAMFPERTNPQEYLVDDWDALCEETPSFFVPRDEDASLAEEARRGF